MTRLLIALMAASLAYAEDMTVYKTATCGCCGKWVEHVRAAGFKVKVVEVPSTAAARMSAGIKEKYGSCHTAKVGTYWIEGHVPAADIQRLLKEKPDAKGLAVPGMPMGSPGMEGPYKDAYSVLLLTKEGSTVFQQYPGSR